MNRSSLRLAAVCAPFLLGAPLAAPLAAGILSGNCRTAEQPAATLLVPYFEVDLQNADGATTLISVNNASSRPTLARVVLWTDWGAPTLSFDIYLTGYDVQSLNLRDLFRGHLPGTGPVVSPQGELSDENTAFAGCEGNAKAVSTMPAASWDFLKAAHTGRPLPGSSTAQCLGSGDKGASIATGYITVDVVNRCSGASVGKAQNTPADPAYFAAGGTGLAANHNVLWGEYISFNPAKSLADSQTAVHILADADAFSAGDYTFYGRYVNYDSRDDRAPLSSLYYVRYLNGGPFSGGTDLVVWRDSRDANVTARSCGTAPSWAPLGEYQMVVFDEEENPTMMPNSKAFPLASQKVHVGDANLAVNEDFGWMMIDLWHSDSTHAQGWVGTVMNAEGRFSVSHTAIRADDLCNFGL
ncbi:MAG TPA: hypothetical protein VN493_24505 [Thermoanaerobaculia bacterium]|nr:hypothetical protein [Thermoanaerobaculia bacterium]